MGMILKKNIAVQNGYDVKSYLHADLAADLQRVREETAALQMLLQMLSIRAVSNTSNCRATSDRRVT